MDRKIVEFLISDKGVNKIAKELRVCKRRVRKFREQSQSMGYLDGDLALPAYPNAVFPETVRPPATDALSEVDELLSTHREWIVGCLEPVGGRLQCLRNFPFRSNVPVFTDFLKDTSWAD